MRDWTPLTPLAAETTSALTAALSLIEASAGQPAAWSERKSWLEVPLTESLRLVLTVPTFSWQVVDERDRTKAQLAAGGETLDAGVAWLHEALATLDLPEPATRPTPSKTQIPVVSEPEAESLTAWLTSANQVLTLLAGTDPGWAPVRCSSAPLRHSTTHQSSQITLALELAGASGEPAFTVTSPRADLPTSAPLVAGTWSEEHGGAVLRASSLDVSGQREQIVSFVADALAQLQA